jgi:exopolysaccharide production protein ExoQ
MKIKPLYIIEVAFLTFAFFLVNIRSLVFWSKNPETDNLVWREMIIWILALIMMLYLMGKQNLFKNYLLTWSKEPVLIIFILFSLASVFWSDMWTVTLHRSLVFTFASVVAVFLGLRYSINDFLRALYWFGAVVIIASFLMALMAPGVGTDFKYNYNGAWRGVFWQKNQLGNIGAILNFIFLFRFFSLKFNKTPSKKVFAAALYFLSLAEIYFAHSASGYVIVLSLHLSYGSAFVWLKIKNFLRPIHYYIIMAVVLVGIIGIFINLGFILSLLNKETTFTGRVPLWTGLLRNIFPLNPWFGKGFGTIWADPIFRIQAQHLAGWDDYPSIGDNGFLDILLNIGVVGLVLFLFNYIKAWVVSVRFFLQELSLEGFFPFIFMIYTFFANLTFSLFMELEVFIWMIIVALMVITTQKRSEILDG